MTLIDKEILAIVRELPDLTRHEVAELMSHLNKYTVFKHLQRMTERGVLALGSRRNPNGNRHFNTYKVAAGPAPTKVLPLVNDRLRDLEGQVATLEAWKEAAIARFPDLAVAPAVLEARKIVAQHFVNGDVQTIMRGGWDDKPIMRVALEAMGVQ